MIALSGFCDAHPASFTISYGTLGTIERCGTAYGGFTIYDDSRAFFNQCKEASPKTINGNKRHVPFYRSMIGHPKAEPKLLLDSSRHVKHARRMIRQALHARSRGI